MCEFHRVSSDNIWQLLQCSTVPMWTECSGKTSHYSRLHGHNSRVASNPNKIWYMYISKTRIHCSFKCLSQVTNMFWECIILPRKGAKNWHYCSYSWIKSVLVEENCWFGTGLFGSVWNPDQHDVSIYDSLIYYYSL